MKMKYLKQNSLTGACAYVCARVGSTKSWAGGALPGRASLKMRPAAAPPRPSSQLYVLIACEESQAECLAFRNLGHIAFSCDLQRARYNPDWHIQSDVTPLLEGQKKFITQSGCTVEVPRWDLIISHPPCTYLCRLSACQMKVHGIMNWNRYRQMILGRRFFLKCLDAPAEYVAVENPVPMRRANIPRPSFYADPSWFGVKYTKKTCYWVKELPPIMPTILYSRPKCYVTSSRGKYRSRTFPQMAEEIAKQWSEFILERRATTTPTTAAACLSRHLLQTPGG